MNFRPTQFELPTENPATLAQFYVELFQWDISHTPIAEFDYWRCKTGSGSGIDGAITKPMYPGQPLTNYVTVNDIVNVIRQGEALGAKVRIPKSAVPGVGWFAILIDPAGHCLGLWQHDSSA